MPVNPPPPKVVPVQSASVRPPAPPIPQRSRTLPSPPVPKESSQAAVSAPSDAFSGVSAQGRAHAGLLSSAASASSQGAIPATIDEAEQRRREAEEQDAMAAQRAVLLDPQLAQDAHGVPSARSKRLADHQHKWTSQPGYQVLSALYGRTYDHPNYYTVWPWKPSSSFDRSPSVETGSESTTSISASPNS